MPSGPIQVRLAVMGDPNKEPMDEGSTETQSIGTDARANPDNEARSTDPKTPLAIDKYEIRSKLGQGGFGVVYLAEQFEPVRRLVALKVIRFGMNTGSMLARFEAERQALAMLNHPGIAKIFDAGQTRDGTSWFAMEFVEGMPITRVLDERQASVHERVRMMIRVCEAVQHAHSKGVIHRDLKPGNILVSHDRSEMTPRIIDFGIAKAVHPEVEISTVTEEGQFLGTPGYMSPEQTGHTIGDVDARTDVYALGAILYLVLAGVPAIPRAALQQARSEGGFVGMTQLIETFEPMRPTARVQAEPPEDAQRVAVCRATDVRKLIRALRGDLDWIVLKCLEPDRERRYETPAAIADDLRRHLESLPISACPPTTAYQLSKFVKRNKALATGTAAVIVALLIGLIASLSLLSRAVDAEHEASVERDTALEMLGALTEGIRAADPSRSGEHASIGDLYRGLAQMIDEGRLGNRPRDGAQLLLAFSITSFNLNEYEDAARYAARVLAYGDAIEPELRNEAKDRLAQARLAMGETYDLAIDAAGTMTPAELMHAQYIAYNLGDYDVAGWHLGSIIQGVDEAVDDNWDVHSTASEYLARLLADQGFFEEAHERLDEAARVRLEYGHDLNDGLTQWDAGTLFARGALLRAEGRFAEAAKALDRAAAMYQTLHGGENRFMVNLAVAEAAAAHRDKEFLAGTLNEVSTERAGLGIMDVILLRNRARALDRLGRFVAADTLFALALEEESRLDEAFKQPGHTRRIWAERLAARGEVERAEHLLDEAIERSAEPRADLLMARARVRAQRARPEEARFDAAAAVKVRRAMLPAEAWPALVSEAEASVLAGGSMDEIEALERAIPGISPAIERLHAIRD
jgi:serine/threonine protein kinase